MDDISQRRMISDLSQRMASSQQQRSRSVIREDSGLNNPFLLYVIAILIVIVGLLYLRSCDEEFRVFIMLAIFLIFVLFEYVLFNENFERTNKIYLYRDEVLSLVETNERFDIFVNELAACFVSQPHMDTRYDQSFYVVSGEYDYIHDWDGKVTRYYPTETIRIPKNTPFQIVNSNKTAGTQIGIFQPGGRFDLVRELDALQRQVGQLTLQQIEEIEARYGVYSVNIPNTLPFPSSGVC